MIFPFFWSLLALAFLVMAIFSYKKYRQIITLAEKYGYPKGVTMFQDTPSKAIEDLMKGLYRAQFISSLLAGLGAIFEIIKNSN